MSQKEEESHSQEKVQTSNPQEKARESTVWAGAGKTSGNLFNNRNWLIPQNYLPSKDKEENAIGIIGPKPPMKENEPKINEQSSEKCGWDQIALFVKVRKREEKKTKLSKS